MFVFAAEDNSIGGALNGAAPEPVTNAEFTKALSRVVSRPAMIPAPKFALRLALGPVADYMLASQRVVPEAAQSAGFRFEHNTIEEALRAVL